jgi:hypothetical protein
MPQKQATRFSIASSGDAPAHASLPEARRIVEAWQTDYHRLRPHSSHDGLALPEFTPRPIEGAGSLFVGYIIPE